MVMTDVQAWCRVTLWGPDGLMLGTWRLEGTGVPGLTIVDSVARSQLAARRIGCRLVLTEVCRDLAELLDLVGLADLIGLAGQVGGETEGREEVLGVEEGVEADDPSA